jgi:hypothetical protein
VQRGQPGKSLTPHEALSRMFAQARAKFDATILNGFIRMMGIYPPGSLVQLSDDRYAMVTSVNSSRPLKPIVRVVDSRPRAACAAAPEPGRMPGPWASAAA